MIVRLLIWSLFDSKSTVEELREKLPPLPEPSAWLWNAASERFGALVVADELPEAVGRARELIGQQPAVFEEFDVLDVRG